MPQALRLQAPDLTTQLMLLHLLQAALNLWPSWLPVSKGLQVTCCRQTAQRCSTATLAQARSRQLPGTTCSLPAQSAGSLAQRDHRRHADGMQQPASLLVVCQQATSHILQRLPAKALACLSCVNTALRAVVDHQPRALWLTAAGLADCAASHPVAAVHDVRAWLRQQHRTHANLTSMRCHTFRLKRENAVPSPDCSKLVTFDEADGALIWELRSGKLLHRWPLPGLSELDELSQLHCWDNTSRILALAWGRACGHQAAVGGRSGLCFLEVATGSCTQVLLPPAAHRLQVVVEGFSAAALLLVRHQGSSLMFLVYSAAGELVSCLAAPEDYAATAAMCQSCSWDPATGEKVLLDCTGLASFWIWDVLGGTICCFNEPAWSVHVWSPASDLVACSSGLYDLSRGRFLPQLASGFSLTVAAWGQRGLVTIETGANPTPLGWGIRANVYRLRGRQLLLTYSAEVARDVPQMDWDMSLAPDGHHCLLDGVEYSFGHRVHSKEDMSCRFRLLLVDLSSGRARQLCARQSFSHWRWRWGSDGSSVLVTDAFTGQPTLFDFS